MKAATLKEIKAELSTIHPQQLIEVCLRLVKYKKENKELLTYLLFDSSNELNYISDVKLHIDEQFEAVNKSNTYLAKKSVRKALRIANKYIKYSGSKQTELEITIYFCKKLRKSGIPLYANTVLGNIYMRQAQRLKKVLSSLHEDLQFDYADEVKLLT
jgi:hypothetical protein